jgi:hypothetical protein
MALAGFIISILAFLFSLFIYFVHDKKIKDQTKLINDYQLQKIEKESIEDKKAKIEATVQWLSNRNRKFLVINKGKSKAKNVNVIFQKIEEFRVNSNPFPIDILPNHSIEINFQVAIGGPDKIELQFEWDDDFQEKNITTQMVQL